MELAFSQESLVNTSAVAADNLDTELLDAYSRAVVGVASLAMPLNYFLVLRLLGLSVRRLCAAMWRPAVAAAAMAIVLRFMIEHWSIQANVLGLTESVVAGAIVYALLLLTLWLCSGRPSGPEQLAISALRG